MQVDFYVLNEAYGREQLACRLTEKAYNQQLRIHLHTDSAEHSQQLDELLWTYREGSFLPHEILTVPDTNSATCPPITISHTFVPPPETKILLNLAADIPPFYTRFDRIIEIVNQNETIRQQGRMRFSLYREQGCNLHHHEINLQTPGDTDR